MATSGTGTSLPAASRYWSYTLEALVNRWRARLEDTREPYLWSNDELTDYCDKLQKELCTELPLIEDRITDEVCNIPLVQGNGLVLIHPRILRITRAILTGEDRPLEVHNSEHMDAYYGNWRGADVAQGVPRILVNEGLGNGQGYLYPPLAAATGNVELTVIRLPLVDLEYETHLKEPLEIDKYAHLLIHGIMYQAYMKQDTDAYDPRKAEQQRIAWEGRDGRGGDKEQIRRLWLKQNHNPMCASPMTAFT